MIVLIFAKFNKLPTFIFGLRFKYVIKPLYNHYSMPTGAQNRVSALKKALTLHWHQTWGSSSLDFRMNKDFCSFYYFDQQAEILELYHRTFGIESNSKITMISIYTVYYYYQKLGMHREIVHCEIFRYSIAQAYVVLWYT